MTNSAAKEPFPGPLAGAGSRRDHRTAVGRVTPWIGRYPSVPVVLLVVIAAGLALGLIHWAARGQDEVSIAKSEMLIRAILEAQIREVGKEALNQAHRGEAVANLSLRPDLNWAERNIGSHAFANLGICASLVLPPQGGPSFAFVAGEKALPGELLGRFGPGLQGLVASARAAAPARPSFAAGLIAFDGAPYIAGASAITPNVGGRAGSSVGERSVLVFLRALDQDFLAALGADFAIDALALAGPDDPRRRPNLELLTAGGTPLGRLQWRIDLPGPQLIGKAVWPLAATFLLLAALAIAVMATIKEGARNLERSLHMLAQRNQDLVASDAAGARLQARLQSALDYSPGAIAFFDADGRLIVSNARLSQVLGMPTASLAPGASFQAVLAWLAGCRLVAPDDRKAADPEGDDLPAPGEYQTPDGRIVEMRRSSTSDRGLVITLRDISEQRRGEAELRAAVHEAKLADRAKTDFLANVSHELRTPLNAILGFSEVMKAQMFGPLGHKTYRSYAGDIHDSGSHLLALINDILDLSKIEAGRRQLDEEIVDPAAVCRSALRIVRERAQAAGLTVGLKLPQQLPPLVADQRAIKQILINLLSNAVKFTPEGGLVTLLARQAANGELRLSVIDSGIGIADEHIPTVLRPFGQVGDALTRNAEEGTGLGLSLSKALAEAHGGGIEIASRVDQGTEVTLVLPAERVRPAAPRPATSIA